MAQKEQIIINHTVSFIINSTWTADSHGGLSPPLAGLV